MKFKYFEYKHFDSPDMPGSGKLVSDELISMLDVARKKYGKPIIPNSGYRTIEHNAKVGGKTQLISFKRISRRYKVYKFN